MASSSYTMVLDDVGLKDRVKSLDSIINLDGLGIFKIMSSLEYNVSMDDPTIIKDVQEYVVPSRERDLFDKLKAIVQDPPLRPFLKNDIM
jgi:adenine-specific DNA methylase